VQQPRKARIFVFNKYFLKNVRSTPTVCQHRYCFQVTLLMIKKGEFGGRGHFVQTEEKRNIHKTLDGNPEGNVGLSFGDLVLKGR